MITPVFIRPSPINGLGVFAKRSFRKGERLLEIDDSRIVDEAHPLRPGEEARHCDYLSGGKVVLMRRPERYINHSCDPNSYVKTVSGRRLVIALRDLAEGEEITYDYCINGDGATTWFCHCGAARCRREIHSDFFHLPIDLQLEYLPLLDDWFREERAAELNQLSVERSVRLGHRGPQETVDSVPSVWSPVRAAGAGEDAAVEEKFQGSEVGIEPCRWRRSRLSE